MSVELIYWDSDAFLGYFQNESDKAELCNGTIERAKQGEILIVTSTLTIAEVLWMRNAPKITADKAEIVRKFFRRSNLRLRNVTRRISENAQDLVWNHAIRPKDAIHVATALDGGIPILETFDTDLIKRTGSIGTPGLIIRAPIASKQGKLL